jgi:phage tail sheath protein FI
VPEYLAPGVYVEETSFRSKSIEGVSTSTTAFVGATLKGPVVPRDDTERWNATPELLTSFADFERIYGSFEALNFGAADVLNHMAHAVQAYFNNGGSRLYVMRVFNGALANAHAQSAAVVETAANDDNRIFLRARFPGRYFNAVTVTVQPLFTPVSFERLGTLPDDTLVRSILPNNTFPAELWVRTGGAWQSRSAPDQALAAVPAGNIVGTRTYQTVSAVVTVSHASGATLYTDTLSFVRNNAAWIGGVLAETQARRSVDLTLPVHLRAGSAIPLTTADAIERLARGLLGDILAAESPAGRSFALAGGSDGAAPATGQVQRALDYLLGLEDVSIVAAPGLSDQQAIANDLINHAERRRAYRIAVLDTPEGQTPTEARTHRGRFDSHRAAMYYPWVVVPNPLASVRNLEPAEIAVPPSGFVCGIYARNDIERGVWKAPANEIVRGALRFERDISFGEQEMLNPIGVNCLRPLPGRGLRVWGARTVSSDPEWKYVSVRRYFNYLEASIDRGTQWAVFEPNGERLWDNVRNTVASFLYNEWRMGALLGTKEAEAYFVRCDRSTMNQNDLDNGRLVCLIGVAVVKPAEFVIFRIGQKTADAKS